MPHHFRRRHNPRCRPDEALALAARILRSEPWRVQGFLQQAGVKPTLAVFFDDRAGTTPNTWIGAPEDWPGYVSDRRIEALEEDEDYPPAEWQILSYVLVYGDPREPLFSRDNWDEPIDLMDPYHHSMNVLG